MVGKKGERYVSKNFLINISNEINKLIFVDNVFY